MGPTGHRAALLEAGAERFVAPTDTKRFFYLLSVAMQLLAAALIGVLIGVAAEAVVGAATSELLVDLSQYLAGAAAIYMVLVLLARTVRTAT